MRDSAAAKTIRFQISDFRFREARKFLIFFGFFFLASGIWHLASAFSSDLFFKGPSDLVVQAEEIHVGKRVSANLAVHYEGKDPAQALVKIFLDGTNITSFPVDFQNSGVQTGNFSFRVETEAKHHFEFVIVTAGEFNDSQIKNNRLTVSFRVPGSLLTFEEAAPVIRKPSPKPVSVASVNPAPRKKSIVVLRSRQPKTVVRQIADQKMLEERERLRKKVKQAKKELESQLIIQKNLEVKNGQEEITGIEEGGAEVDQADAIAYLDREPQNLEEKMTPAAASFAPEPLAPEPVSPLSIGSAGKPLIDIFFADSSAFKLSDSKVRKGQSVAWELQIRSSGRGEGEVEVVVADGNKKIVSQKVLIHGGESLRLTMQSVFDRPGPHRLTAMINTENNIVDRNLDNNIIEQTIQVG